MAKPKQPGIKGIHLLFITPLNEDYTLNEQAVRDQVEWCVQNGLQGIWAGGYIGEWTVLEEETKKRLYEVIVEQNKGRLYISAGAHGINTLQAIRLVNHAEEIGCDSAWISPPTPRKMTEDEIYGHYEVIHDNTRLPIGLYNTYPKNIYVRPTLMARIAELERVVTIKDAIGDIMHIGCLYNECAEAIKEGFEILGVPYNMLPHMLYGGAGVTSNNWDAAICLEQYDAVQKGDIKRACELQLMLSASWPFVFAEALALQAYGAKIGSSGIGAMKAKASLCMGIDMGPPMRPFAPPTEAEIQAVKESLERLPIKVKPFQK
jgi:4-hydroxy-tetrahydrodipicolinate synthase